MRLGNAHLATDQRQDSPPVPRRADRPPRNSGARPAIPLCRDTAGAEPAAHLSSREGSSPQRDWGREERTERRREGDYAFCSALNRSPITFSGALQCLKCCSMQETRKATRSMFITAS